jgi:hypothetical protein
VNGGSKSIEEYMELASQAIGIQCRRTVALPKEVGEAETSTLALALMLLWAALLECTLATVVVVGSKPCRKADHAT